MTDRLLLIQWSTHRGLLMALLCVLGIILVAPVWTVRYPPLVDFPNHLASSFVLAHLNDPRFHFNQFYAPNWQLSPYVLMDLILVGLQKFLPVEVAGKVLLTLSLVAVPPAVWMFVREANPGESRLAFWSLLVCNNMYFFLYGFINMQLSLALCFFTLGLWLRYLKSPAPWRWWAACGSATILYFAHIVGFGVAGIVVTCYLLAARRSFREVIHSWTLFLPGTALYLYWKTSIAGNWRMTFPSLLMKIETLPAIMRGYSFTLDFITLLVLLACLFWVVADNPEFHLNIPWAATIATLFAVYLALPSGYGPGGMVARRLLPFILIIGMAGAKVGRRGAQLVPLALLLFAVRTANVELNFVSLQPHLKGLTRSFSAIPRNARVVPIVHRRVDAGTPEDSFWSYGVIERGWFSPYLFHDKGVQPLQIRLRTYTFGQYAAFVSLGAPMKWSRIKSDYDYIWAYGASDYSSQMAAIGKLVYRSDGVEVFQITKLAAKRHQKAKDGTTLRQQKVTPKSSPTGGSGRPSQAAPQHTDS